MKTPRHINQPPGTFRAPDQPKENMIKAGGRRARKSPTFRPMENSRPSGLTVLAGVVR